MHIGYEIFYVKPGEALEKACGICGANCDRNEKVYSAASFAAAVGKKYDFHDVFVCPHAGQEWHEQALRLVLAIEETPSKRVADLMRLDLADLLAENGL